MHCFAQSDKGAIRKENQDRAACAHIRRKGCTVAVVCDGMGGQSAGNVASDMARTIIADKIRKNVKRGGKVFFKHLNIETGAFL